MLGVGWFFIFIFHVKIGIIRVFLLGLTFIRSGFWRLVLIIRIGAFRFISFFIFGFITCVGIFINLIITVCCALGAFRSIRLG